VSPGMVSHHEREILHLLPAPDNPGPHNPHNSLASANLELDRSSLLLHHFQTHHQQPEHWALAVVKPHAHEVPSQGQVGAGWEVHTSRALLEQLGVYDWEEYWLG